MEARVEKLRNDIKVVDDGISKTVKIFNGNELNSKSHKKQETTDALFEEVFSNLDLDVEFVEDDSDVSGEENEIDQNDKNKNQEIPQQLNEPILLFKATKNIKPVDIACTATTGFFLDEHKNIYSWGYGNTLGHGNSTKSLIQPEKIDLTFFGINRQKFGDDPFLEKLPEIVDIQTGIEHVVAITSDGGAYGWGRNYDGRLGNNTTRDVSYPFPILLPELCVGAACGMDHTVFVTSHVV